MISREYDCFSDLATLSLNCQARSAAIFVGMVKAGKIDEVRDYHSYLALFRTREDGRPTGPESYEKVQLLQKKNVMLFSPVVPCIYRKEDVERYC